MFKTIQTFIEFRWLVEDKTFNEILGMAKMGCKGDFHLISDVDDFNNNEIKCCIEYRGIRVIVELCYGENGKYVRLGQFCKEGGSVIPGSQMVEVIGNEIDWADMYVYALNNSTKEFENCSGIKRYFKISASQVTDIESAELDSNADYILFTEGTMEKAGWIIVAESNKEF